MFRFLIALIAFTSVVRANAEPTVILHPDDVIKQEIVKACRRNYHQVAGPCACYDNRKNLGFQKCGMGSADEQRRNRGLLGLFCFPHQITDEDIRKYRGGDKKMIDYRCGKTPR